MIFNRQHAINNPELQKQETLLLQLFQRHQSLTILDIGACEGESSIRYSRLFPNATVYCFEPIAANFKLIQKNILQYNLVRIFAYELCLSDSTGNATMHVSSGKPQAYEGLDADWDFGNKSSSLLPPEKTLDYFEWLSFNQSCTVQTMRLDDFCSSHNLMAIDFIHMDVQGAELMVLKGAGKTIKQIKNIWLEVSNVALYAGQPLQKEVESFLLLNGYVKLIDTVDNFSGDQFWSNAEWVTEKMGDNWLRENLYVEHITEKPSLLQRIRAIVRLRTRLKNIWQS